MAGEIELKRLFWEMVSEYARDHEYAPSNVEYRKGKIAGFQLTIFLVGDLSLDFQALVTSTTYAVIVTHTQEDAKLA